MAYTLRHRRSLRFLSCEEFEARLCLSAVSFASHDIVESEADGPNSVFAADLDGDGDVDVLSASDSDQKIAWYENTDGKGSFGQQRVITTEAETAPPHYPLFAADLDGDGDMDVLSDSGWYENTDGKGSFDREQIIATAVLAAADLDRDGDLAK